MKQFNIPGRAFLDTSVINFILDFGEQIHDGIQPPDDLNDYQIKDIDALYNIFLTGKSASWQFAISPQVYHEVIKTNNPHKKKWLTNWFFEIWEYWREIINKNDDLPNFIEAENIRLKLLTSDMLVNLPDFYDKLLIIDAIVYNCDLFCTRDWKSILKHRDNLKDINIPILTPNEWWGKIKPYANIF